MSGAGTYLLFLNLMSHQILALQEQFCQPKTIKKTHPVFQGYGKNYRNIMWGGGPAFHIPAGENIEVLAWYPQECLSSHPQQKIHIWKYPGRVPHIFDSGLSPMAAWRAYWGWLMLRHAEDFGARSPNPHWGYYFRTGWDKTNEEVKTYIQGEPAIIASIYGQGRVIASGVHPEFSTWNSDAIIEAQDNSSNPLGNLFHWDNEEANEKYNWWLLRRMVAYVAKVPDSDLPPIPSQGDNWWNTAWSKRRPIYLSVDSGYTPQNYQVKLHINYDSDMKPDFSDLRFIRYSDNSTELDYWIEDKSDGNWADVWVEIPDSITTTDKPMVWMYYGNPDASSASNGENTFHYFDHWMEDNTGDWKYANTGNNHYHWWLNNKEFTGYRELRMKANLLNWWSGAWDHTQLGWSEDKSSYVNSVNHVTIYFEHRRSNGADDSHVSVKLHIRKGDNTYTTSLKSFPKPDPTDNLYLKLTYYSDRVSYEIIDMDTGDVLASDSITGSSKIPSPTNTKYFLHQDWDFGGGLHTWLSPTYLEWGNKQTNGGMIWKTDYWFIRKYHDPEPTYDIGAEESS